MACMTDLNLVVIHDLATGDQKKIEVNEPLKCASSQHVIAVTTSETGMHLYSTHGDFIHIVPDSTDTQCGAFHPHNTNMLAIGYKDGTVRIWDVSADAYVSSFKQHTDQIFNIRFAPDGRLLLSSADKTASIVTLDDDFQFVSLVKLKGLSVWVNDILTLLSFNQCVTCSDDKAIKVWDCETGACLRTMTEHGASVFALALHLNAKSFASGSFDLTVIIWSSETFEVLHRILFPEPVQALLFSRRNTWYVAVYDHGVMSGNGLTGDVGPVIIPGTGYCESLSLGKPPSSTPQYTLLTHTRTPQYLHPSPGLHPHMHCGPCLHNTLCTWLWWCCGRCAIRDD